MKKKKKTLISTNLVRGGVNRSHFNETSEALFLTSGFIYDSAEQAEACFNDTEEKYMYSRFGNPTVDSLEKKLSILEGSEDCLATSSGMSAVFSIFMSQLKVGDRVVSSKALFGSCYYIIKNLLPKFGIKVVFVDGTNLNEWEKALNKKTNLVFFETPSNPCLEIIDINAVSIMAHKVGAKVIVDNVFASPILQKPMDFGADIVMYSATKHIDGQGRVLGGAILSSKKFCKEIVKPFIKNTGPSISPFNAWILLKSLDTLNLRVNKQVKNTLEVLKFLENHKKVQRVIYPFSKNFKQLKLAKKQMKAGGTVISFEINTNKNKKKETFKIINKFKMIDISNNLGDTKTLITHPFTTTHSRLEKMEKKSLRITENLLRLSVGLEDSQDIIHDLETALK